MSERPICPRCQGLGCAAGDRSKQPKGYCPDCAGSGRLPIVIGSCPHCDELARVLEMARHALVSSGADCPATLREIDSVLPSASPLEVDVEALRASVRDRIRRSAPTETLDQVGGWAWSESEGVHVCNPPSTRHGRCVPLYARSPALLATEEES